MIKTLVYIALYGYAFHCYSQTSDFKDIDFKKADRIALECKGYSLSNMPNLALQLTEQLSTDVEKFRAIYRWVCGNIANDYQYYEKNKNKRRRFSNDSIKLNQWNATYRKKAFKTLLVDQKTICTGYAYLVKELSRLANINCEVVDGYAKTSTIKIEELELPNHSWNAVQLNGKWYLCDPTWASGTPNASTFRFEFNYNDGYFLPDPKLFAINHFPLDKKWLLLDDANYNFETFLESPVIYGKAYTNLTTYNAPKKMHNTIKRYQHITFTCELLKEVSGEDISLLIDAGSHHKKIHPIKTTIVNNIMTIEYAFDNVGFYDVHLFIGLDLIASYTFRVKS